MEFRPCIDIHNGKVRQIVGSSLRDEGDKASVNFTSDRGGAYFANFYKGLNLSGGHVIMLNHEGSQYFGETKRQALEALRAWPGALLVGGGIDAGNAREYIDAGASKVIVTSSIFKDGELNFSALDDLSKSVGAGRLALDLSCRMKDDRYYVVTDRWQNFTSLELNLDNLKMLEGHCSEYLIHGVDVEGKSQGVDVDLLKILGSYMASGGLPVTYAGGVASYEDLELVKEAGLGLVDVTVGSALDIFGGNLSLDEILRICA